MIVLALFLLAVQDRKGADMDYGPFLSSSVSRAPSDKDEAIVAAKAVTVKVGPDAAVCFDTETLRWAAAWKGGFLDLSKTHLTSSKGSLPPRVAGTVALTTPKGPAWNMPGRFRGLYRNGERVVFSYTVGDCAVLDLPGWAGGAFTRTFHLGPSALTLATRVADGAAPATLVGAGASLAMPELKIPPHAEPLRLTIVFAAAATEAGPDLPALTRGGPARWAEPVVTDLALGKEEGPYSVDTLTLPDANPWKSWIRPGALDCFSDGRVAISTWSGDVWIVSEAAGKLSWRRFAAGLYEPLGLKIVDDRVHVLGRDQITVLRDPNGDGEADFYECLNNGGVASPIYHAFHYDLQTDREGNFYYVVGGHHAAPDLPFHNCMIKVSRDGSALEAIATGFRAANGMGVGPNDEITSADNEGNWVPATRLDRVRKGGFYGFVSDPTKTNARNPAPRHGPLQAPLCWIPKAADNSAGGQVWVTGDRWGPLRGHMLHTSYGTASLFHVLQEQVGDTVQGGVVRFPLQFSSGIMRARFNPKDGQLYVCGLRGWQTTGARDGCLQRVRYTGRPLRTVADMRVRKGAIELAFTDPLDPDSAGDAGNYAAQMWNYEYSEKYGSPEFSVLDPKKKGRDPVEILSARVSSDGMRVTLETPGLRPCMQMSLRMRIKAADGGAVSLEIMNTIHKVPE